MAYPEAIAAAPADFGALQQHKNHPEQSLSARHLPVDASGAVDTSSTLTPVRPGAPPPTAAV